jgi:hypothetical protein
MPNLSALALSLRPEANRLDHDADALRTAYMHWQKSGLRVEDFHRDLALLASASGAFAFLILQEAVSGQPGCGVAFGHLRTGKGPRWHAGKVSGIIPWMTGAGIFSCVKLGVLLPDGSEAYATVDVQDSPTFRHHPAMTLLAGTSMQTVAVTLTDFPLEESAFMRIDAPGTAAAANAQSLVGHTPLLFGNCDASLRLIRDAPRLSESARERAHNMVRRLRAERETTAPSHGAAFRARVADTAIRLATLATMACGSSSLQTGSDAERIYREALLFTLMAQTDPVVETAFEEILP